MSGVPGNYASTLYIVVVKANVLDKVESELLTLVEASKRSPTFSQLMKDLSVIANTRVKAINDFCAQAKFVDITKIFLANCQLSSRARQQRSRGDAGHLNCIHVLSMLCNNLKVHKCNHCSNPDSNSRSSSSSGVFKFGNLKLASDWTFAAEQFVLKLPDKFFVHCSERNMAKLTLDGVDVMGKRLAEEYPQWNKSFLVSGLLVALLKRQGVGVKGASKSAPMNEEVPPLLEGGGKIEVSLLTCYLVILGLARLYLLR
ncbi:unnamed protein product [Fraxinus pennsylvanica]|uniref:DUF676 domain-containing protein n=1 Tax=Fraxinus pennsylvanica TaxID=56036 RepID=A0AAD1ZZC8_9LAMI|nr:unnamed protein product [Fraxinus pennsylvanica]